MERMTTRRVVSTAYGGPTDRAVTVHPGPFPIVECDACGYRWSPNRLTGGRLGRRFWLCPQFGCNHPTRG